MLTTYAGIHNRTDVLYTRPDGVSVCRTDRDICISVDVFANVTECATTTGHLLNRHILYIYIYRQLQVDHSINTHMRLHVYVCVPVTIYYLIHKPLRCNVVKPSTAIAHMYLTYRLWLVHDHMRCSAAHIYDNICTY